MRKLVSAISLSALWLLSASNSLATPSDVASSDWSVAAVRNLAANPPSKEAQVTFVASLEGIAPHFSICSSHFADLRHSGALSMVVSKSNGRFCDLSIFDKTSTGFEVHDLQLAHYADGPEIKDLDGNGNLELIVPTDVTGYQGAQHCIAQWPVIYAWTGNGYGDVSGRYRAFYQEQLASLKKQIAVTEAQKEPAERRSAAPQGSPASDGTASAGPAVRALGRGSAESPGQNLSLGAAIMEQGTNGSFGQSSSEVIFPSPPPQVAPLAPDRLGLDCTKVEAAKIERFLGISRDAGMSDAIKWANSTDPSDREFATDVFDDIATPEAVEYLKTLGHDPDRQVAASAKISLKQVGPTLNTVEHESITDDADASAATAH